MFKTFESDESSCLLVKVLLVGVSLNNTDSRHLNMFQFIYIETCQYHFSVFKKTKKKQQTNKQKRPVQNL